MKILILKVNNACASGSSALLQCKQLLQGGIYDVALALGKYHYFKNVFAATQVLEMVPIVDENKELLFLYESTTCREYSHKI